MAKPAGTLRRRCPGPRAKLGRGATAGSAPALYRLDAIGPHVPRRSAFRELTAEAMVGEEGHAGRSSGLDFAVRQDRVLLDIENDVELERA